MAPKKIRKYVDEDDETETINDDTIVDDNQIHLDNPEHGTEDFDYIQDDKQFQGIQKTIIEQKRQFINKNYEVKQQKVSYRIITQFEIVRMISIRTQQLIKGAQSTVPDDHNTEEFSYDEIAKMEIYTRRIPLYIARPFPNKIIEIVKLDEKDENGNYMYLIPLSYYITDDLIERYKSKYQQFFYDIQDSNI